MPYDIAAHQKLPSELRAINLANVNTDLQNKLLSMSAKYYEDTGTSEASQKQQELDIRSEANLIDRGNLSVRIGELKRGLKQDAQKDMTDFMEKSAFIYRYMQTSKDAPGAEALYNQLLESTGAGEHFKGGPLEKFNPEVLKAMATASQVETPLIPVNAIDLNSGEIHTIGRDDYDGMKEAIKKGWYIDPAANLLSGPAANNVVAAIQNDAASIRNFAGREQTFSAVFNLIKNINAKLGDPNIAASIGTVGGVFRGLESLASQVMGAVQSFKEQPVVNDKTGENLGKLDGFVEKEFNSLLAELPSNFKSIVENSAELQTMIKMLVYAAARIQGTNNDRLSDNDVKHWMDIFNVGSVLQLKAAVRTMGQQLTTELAVSRRVMDPDGKLAKRLGNLTVQTDEILKDITSPSSYSYDELKQRLLQGETLSDEEWAAYQQLKEGKGLK